MIRNARIIRSAAQRVAEAANRALDDFKEGLVEQEPQLTDRMLGRIAEAMSGFQTKGVQWTAKTLTDRGSHSQESQFGADFVGVLEIKLAGYKVRKGFLAQAKRFADNKPLSSSEFQRMKDQCRLMLKLSPDSFVFQYSPKGIRVIPATAIVGSAKPAGLSSLRAVYSRSIERFYEDHFASFIGDREISASRIATLERLREHLRARHLLYLLARQQSRATAIG